MNTKKKSLKIFLTVIIFISITLGCGYIFYKFCILNSNDIIGDTNSSVPDSPPNQTIESDFVFENSEINFTKQQKLRIINFGDNSLYINQQEFKYYFLIEFNKLGPKKEKINITFNFDDASKASKVSIIYDANSHHIWNYIIKHI